MPLLWCWFFKCPKFYWCNCPCLVLCLPLKDEILFKARNWDRVIWPKLDDRSSGFGLWTQLTEIEAQLEKKLWVPSLFERQTDLKITKEISDTNLDTFNRISLSLSLYLSLSLSLFIFFPSHMHSVIYNSYYIVRVLKFKLGWKTRPGIIICQKLADSIKLV